MRNNKSYMNISNEPLDMVENKIFRVLPEWVNDYHQYNMKVFFRHG